MNPKQKNSLVPKKYMKSDSSVPSNSGPSVFSAQTLTSSQYLSGQAKREASGAQHKRSQQQSIGAKKFSMARQVVMLSKSMEKSFRRLNNKEARKAFVEAELVNGLAHQIRILRQQRGWTQQDLASKLETTQTAISRLEDPSYGRFSVKSLLALAGAFDVALHVRFESFSKFLHQTWDTSEENFRAESYVEECQAVQFFSEVTGSTYVSSLTHRTTESLYKNTMHPALDAPNELVRMDTLRTIGHNCGYVFDSVALINSGMEK